MQGRQHQHGGVHLNTALAACLCFYEWKVKHGWPVRYPTFQHVWPIFAYFFLWYYVWKISKDQRSWKECTKWGISAQSLCINSDAFIVPKNSVTKIRIRLLSRLFAFLTFSMFSFSLYSIVHEEHLSIKELFHFFATRFGGLLSPFEGASVVRWCMTSMGVFSICMKW